MINYILNSICRAVGKVVLKLFHLLSIAVVHIGVGIDYVCTAVTEMFALIYEKAIMRKGRSMSDISLARKLFSFGDNIKAAIDSTRGIYNEYGFNGGVKSLIKDIGHFFRAIWRSVAPVLSYVAPIVSVVLCVLVINANKDFTYGIKVTLKDEYIGTVENESVYNKALGVISARVEEATGESYTLNMLPSFEVVKVDKSEIFTTQDEIESSIVEGSPELFKESTGLYINDKLIAVMPDSAEVGSVLDGILQNAYEEYAQMWDMDEIDYKLSFVDTVELRDGLYPITESMTMSELKAYLTAVTDSQKVYTVVSGDSIKRIANTFEISTEELYSMNTWLKETTVIYPGDKIIVANEVPFMQVKMTCTATFEEKTSIPVEYVESKSYYVGVTKVKSNGSAGTDMVTAEISYINGVEVDRIVLSRDSVKKAVPKVVYKGTKSGYTLPTLKGSYIRPVDDGRISSPYGYRTHPVTGEKESFHTGLDIATKKDTPIHAAASGTIIFMAKSGNYGNLVKIDHGNGYVTYYAHCNSFASGLKVGSKVTVGDTIAYVGMTGRATGYHVHFEIRYKNQTVNINKLFPN